MDSITKPSISRLARRSGVKSVSDDCYDTIRKLIVDKLNEVVEVSLVVNSEHQTKTLMSDDIYNSLHLLGYNIAQSCDLGTVTCNK
jgi:histone H3/H4